MYEIRLCFAKDDKGELFAIAEKDADAKLIAQAVSNIRPYGYYRVMVGAGTVYLYSNGRLVV